MKGDVISDHFLMLWFQKDALDMVGFKTFNLTSHIFSESISDISHCQLLFTILTLYDHHNIITASNDDHHIMISSWYPFFDKFNHINQIIYEHVSSWRSHQIILLSCDDHLIVIWWLSYKRRRRKWKRRRIFFPTSTVNLRRAKLYVCLVFRSFMQLREQKWGDTKNILF